MKSGVVILDLKNSQQMTIEDRVCAQKKLMNAIVIANKFYKDSIVAKLSFSAGDSVQGVFNSVGRALSCALLSSMLVYPYEVRGGIGEGEILDELVCEDTNRIDGEAYYNAIEALKICKSTKRSFLVKTLGYPDYAINEVLYAINYISETHSEKQSHMRNLFGTLSFSQRGDLSPSAFFAMVSSHIIDVVKRYKTDADKNFESDMDLSKIFKNEKPLRMHLLADSLYIDKAADSSLFKPLCELLGVTAENVRQMAERSDYGELERLRLCALALCGENIVVMD